jgi:hypothetical protein
MKTLIGVLLIAGLVGGMTIGLAAREEAYGAFVFLEGSGGARALALGGAFVALADDWSAPFWNPAGMSQVQTPSFGVMAQNKFQAGIQDIFSGGVLPVDPKLALGGAINILQVSDLEGTNGSDQELVYTFAVSTVWQDINLGIAGKYYSQSLLGASSKGFGLDCGLLYQFKPLTFGLAVDDVGDSRIQWTTQATDFVLSRWRAGITLLSKNLKVLTQFDYTPRIDETLWRFGIEVGFGPLQIRSGVKLQRGYPFWSIGAGWQWQSIKADIAYLTHPQLPDNIALSIAFVF